MAVNTTYNNYNAVYDHSSEVKKEKSFAKDNGLDYDLLKKGQTYESALESDAGPTGKKLYDYENWKTVNVPDGSNPSKTKSVSADSEEGKAEIAKLIEERDKAIAEYAKYKELKGAASNAVETKGSEGQSKAANNSSYNYGGKNKYDTASFSMDKIREIKADMKGNIGAYKKMVAGQVNTQAGYADTTLKSMLKKVVNLSPAEAAANISEDGEWGVNKTAERILNFAKALAGDDPSKIATLRDAVRKGFGAAEKVWGGALPGISYQTLQKVMDGFDEWEKSYNQ